MSMAVSVRRCRRQREPLGAWLSIRRSVGGPSPRQWERGQRRRVGTLAHPRVVAYMIGKHIGAFSAGGPEFSRA